MGQIEKTIREKLKKAFCPQVLEVLNESSQHQIAKKEGEETKETHFRVLLVSAQFEGLSKVLRHQMVYKCLKEEIKGPVHAFSQSTFTPREWSELYAISSTPACSKKVTKTKENS